MLSISKFISISVILCFALNAGAFDSTVKKKASQKRRAQPRPVLVDNTVEEKPETRSKASDLLAIPVGGIIGYGLGHGLQGRFSTRGWIYTGVDLIALGFIGATMGSCREQDTSCDDNKDQTRDIGIALFVGSRLAQIFDLTYFFSQQTYANHHSKNKIHFAIIPDSRGSLQANLNFSF